MPIITHSLCSFFFLSSSRLSSPWDAAVVSLPGLPAETLDQLHPPPLHCRTLTLPHTLCQRSSTGGPRPPGGPRRYCRGSAKLFHLKHFSLFQKLKTSNRLQIVTI